MSSLRERALRLLARREHARAELARKLSAYSESAEELEALLDELSARRLLSDERYAEMRINARGARFGNARLAYELRSQGVPEELIGDALEECDDELSRARKVFMQKFANCGETHDSAQRARQTRFLMNRGFSGETIRRLLRGDFEEDE